MSQVLITWERRPSQPTAEALRAVIDSVLRRLGRDGAEVHVLITGDQRIRELNHHYRSHDAATDVLSFPDGDLLPTGLCLLGQVVISLDTARRQAQQLGHSELRELEELVLHGLLHLLGYDHECDSGTMNEIEVSLRQECLS